MPLKKEFNFFNKEDYNDEELTKTKEKSWEKIELSLSQKKTLKRAQHDISIIKATTKVL